MDKVSLSKFRDARKHQQELYEQYKEAAKPYEDICINIGKKDSIPLGWG